MASYSTVQRGSLYKDDFRLYFKDPEGKIISPFHDIPLFHDEGKSLFNMVVEVPRWTNAKMEISKDVPLNPIKQDVKKGNLRFVANCYPYVGYMWNYGALPQTWEDPAHVDESTGCRGDNDPMDVCEIGQRVKHRGEVVVVKALGVVALIDEGETDWKVIAIDVKDPLADKLNSIADVEQHMPGLLADTVRWFKIYKVPDGKPLNEFAFNGDAKDHNFAIKTILDLHTQWKKMMAGASDPEGTSRVSAASSEFTEDLVSKAEVGPDMKIPGEVDKWHFIQG